MATLIQPVDAYAGLNSVIKQRLGVDVIKDDTIDWVGFATTLDGLDSQTSQIVTSELVTLVTKQVVLPAVYKDLGVDVVANRGAYSPSVGVTQRSRPAIPELKSDAAAYNPTPGSSSDPFKNYAVEMYTNYYFKAYQAMIAWSAPDRWLTGAFLSEQGFTDFLSSIRSAVDFQVRASIDATTFAAIRGSIALNLNTPGNRVYNLLTEFNAISGTTLTQANCMQSPDFLRYASQRIKVVMDDMSNTSVLFNEREYPSYTDFNGGAHVLLLSRFQRAMESNLQSDTFHKELVALPNHATVPAWKGLLSTAGGGITFESASTVKDTFDFQNPDDPDPVKINQSGVIGHLFAKRRVQIEDLGEHMESMRDPVGLKTNYFTHLSGRVVVDDYENAVTFLAADPVTP